MFQKSKITFLISTLLVLLFFLAGCGEPSSITNTNSSNTQKEQVKEFYQVGETAATNGTKITVLKVEKSKGTEFDKPKSGMEFVIVTVKIKNTGKDKLSYNPFYFKMQNSKGQITDIALSTVNHDTALQSGDLAPGGEIEGTLIFEEPINDSGLILQYQNNIFSKEVKLQFKLNQ